VAVAPVARVDLVVVVKVGVVVNDNVSQFDVLF
jgi:hypothetical protein